MTDTVFDDDDDDEECTTHLFPTEDICEHEASAECWCQPQADEDDPTIYVHTSADGREHFDGPRTLH